MEATTLLEQELFTSFERLLDAAYPSPPPTRRQGTNYSTAIHVYTVVPT